MALNVAQVKQITDNIESTYQSLRRAASSLATLVTSGRATCAEVKAYNLWALATYNAQRGMLATLRAAGEQNVPALPPSPTLFVWKGISGSDAWKIDCGSQVGSLHGAMVEATAAHGPQTSYLSSNQLSIWNGDAGQFNPSAAPSLASLAPQTLGSNGLGVAPVVLVLLIAGLLLTLYVGIPALMAYLEENSIQVETTNRMRVSSAAYAAYIDARAQCLASCLNNGGTSAACVTSCEKLVPAPDLTVDSARAPLGLGFWAMIGLAVVAVGGGAYAYNAYQKRQGHAVPA